MNLFSYTLVKFISKRKTFMSEETQPVETQAETSTETPAENAVEATTETQPENQAEAPAQPEGVPAQ
jgi:hypothetical protein